MILECEQQATNDYSKTNYTYCSIEGGTIYLLYTRSIAFSKHKLLIFFQSFGHVVYLIHQSQLVFPLSEEWYPTAKKLNRMSMPWGSWRGIFILKEILLFKYPEWFCMFVIHCLHNKNDQKYSYNIKTRLADLEEC